LGWSLWQKRLLVETSLVGLAGAGLGVLLAQRLMDKTAEFASAGHAYIDIGLRLDPR
jgi:hypothetical protein